MNTPAIAVTVIAIALAIASTFTKLPLWVAVLCLGVGFLIYLLMGK